MKTIYVLFKSEGEYDDWHKWMVGATVDLEKAKARCDK